MITKEEVMKLATLGRIEELAKLGDEAVDILIAELQDPHFNTNQTCINSLVEIAKSDEETFQRLVEELKSNKDLKIKANCAKILGMIKDPRAANILIEGLKYDNYFIIQEYIEALTEIAKTNENTFQKLITELENNKEWEIKEVCIRSLSLTMDPRAANYLITGLSNGILAYSSTAQKACIIALAEIAKTNDDIFQKIIHHSLNNPDDQVRANYIEILGLTRDPRTVDFLLKIFKDKNIHIRVADINAMGNICDKRVVDLLIMEMINRNSAICRNCAMALEKIGDPQGLAFKKIIYEKSKKYVKKIGIVKTLEIIKEYIELIKDYRPKERVTEIKIDLYSFFRKVFEKESNSRMRMDLPELKMKPPKRGPMLHAQLRVAT
ncbi:MAG: HEAT repeat domain-containing protein [Candidatus Micrarchaeia archaeon]